MNIRDFVKDSLEKFYKTLSKYFFPQPKYEHVYVVCRAASGYEDSMSRESTEGGKVHVKMFLPSPFYEEEYDVDIPENGVVELDIPYGYHYQVHSTLDGYGASFRLVFEACTKERYIHLWNMEIGVWNIGYDWVCSEDGEHYRCIPLLSSYDYFEDDRLWDANECNGYDYDCRNNDDISDDYSEEYGMIGILVSTTDSSFVLYYGGIKSDTTLKFSSQGYARSIPGLKEYYTTNNHDYEAAMSGAQIDFDGAINSEKVLGVLYDAPAVQYAAKSPIILFQSYLPSAGELGLVYNNKSAINSLASTLSYSWAIDGEFYLSSCVFDVNHAVSCSLDSGGLNNFDKSNPYYVMRLSAFHFSCAY